MQPTFPPPLLIQFILSCRLKYSTKIQKNKLYTHKIGWFGQTKNQMIQAKTSKYCINRNLQFWKKGNCNYTERIWLKWWIHILDWIHFLKMILLKNSLKKWDSFKEENFLYGCWFWRSKTFVTSRILTGLGKYVLEKWSVKVGVDYENVGFYY